MIYKILDIIRGTTVDGPGFRTSIYMAGCTHQCQGCHNPQSWDPAQGHSMSLEEILEIVEEEDFNVTLTGGDPLYNPRALGLLIKALKENRRNVWIYTGFIWEEISRTPEYLKAIEEADVLVDGPFIEDLKNPDLFFRGSSNQRIIDIQASLRKDEIVLIEGLDKKKHAPLERAGYDGMFGSSL